MYDPLESELSYKELVRLCRESSRAKIKIAVIGGWASFFYVNEAYRRAFGQDYMSSRDIDVYFDPEKEKEFSELISKLGFEKNRFHFRYENIYSRVAQEFIIQEDAKKEEVYNLPKFSLIFLTTLFVLFY